jgi:hypothetical protein
MFYDQNTSTIEHIFKLALTLQSFLVADPVNGDLAMQEYLYPVMTTAALIYMYGPKATEKLDFGDPKNGFSKVRFLQQYKNKMMSMVDIHAQEWKVSTPDYHNLCTVYGFMYIFI